MSLVNRKRFLTIASLAAAPVFTTGLFNPRNRLSSRVINLGMARKYVTRTVQWPPARPDGSLPSLYLEKDRYAKVEYTPVNGLGGYRRISAEPNQLCHNCAPSPPPADLHVKLYNLDAYSYISSEYVETYQAGVFNRSLRYTQPIDTQNWTVTALGPSYSVVVTGLDDAALSAYASYVWEGFTIVLAPGSFSVSGGYLDGSISGTGFDDDGGMGINLYGDTTGATNPNFMGLIYIPASKSNPYAKCINDFLRVTAVVIAVSAAAGAAAAAVCSQTSDVFCQQATTAINSIAASILVPYMDAAINDCVAGLGG